jgi:2'-5' RNA ligase
MVLQNRARASGENRGMHLAYVILLPDAVHNFIRRAQARVYERYEASPGTLTLEPHITLKQPFETDEPERCEAFLDHLAEETDPFQLVLHGFGFFEREGVTFLDVEQDERLLLLQHRIMKELGLEPAEYESGKPIPYYFHATIATGLSRENLDDARATLGETPVFRFPLERLGMFRREREDTWTLYKRVRL